MTEELDQTYLFGANSVFIEELYEKYQQDPRSVGEDWQRFFGQLGNEPVHRPSWGNGRSAVIGQVSEEDAPKKKPAAINSPSRTCCKRRKIPPVL